MLSVFPQLFDYSQLAPLILRVGLGVILIKVGYKNGFVGALQILAAVFIILGLFIQVAALLALATCYKIKEKKIMLLVVAVALSLIFLGPGLISLDLPL